MVAGNIESHPVHALSIVIPVYKGEASLPGLIDEILPLCEPGVTPGGRRFVVSEVILVHDNGPDSSDVVMQALAEANEVIKLVWLSRNFGQHAATLAGMSASQGEWIVTMDEDGQHDPAEIPHFLDAAMDSRSSVVYAKPINSAPHGAMRNVASRAAKKALNLLFVGTKAQEFQSYRLLRGVIGRQLASFAVSGVYLDVALGWVTDRMTSVPVTLREEGDRQSGYNYASLFAHFWRMVLSSGTRGLRLVSLLGLSLGVIGIGLTVYFIVARLVSGDESVVPGWTSQVVITLICSGAILVSLGVIAEYIGVTLNVAMGRPLYLVVDDPFHSLPPTEQRPAATTDAIRDRGAAVSAPPSEILNRDTAKSTDRK